MLMTADQLELKRLRKIVTLAEMLIQPDGAYGVELVGNIRFRKALLSAVRGYKYTDPFEVKRGRESLGLENAKLRKIAKAAQKWRDAEIKYENAKHSVRGFDEACNNANAARIDFDWELSGLKGLTL